jgi:hypothetical protein
MASFNQSPLSQATLTLPQPSLSLGSDTSAAYIETSSGTFVFDGSGSGETVVSLFSAMRPSWRRESKIVSPKQ